METRNDHLQETFVTKGIPRESRCNFWRNPSIGKRSVEGSLQTFEKATENQSSFTKRTTQP